MIYLQRFAAALKGRSKEGPPNNDTPSLMYLDKNGDLPIILSEQLEQTLVDLRSNPETGSIIEDFEHGPNAQLYDELVKRLAAEKLPAEERARLFTAAIAVFFGNAITDAYIETWMKNGSADRALQTLGEIYLLDLSEVRVPTAILLEERVAEIQRGDFALPQNPADIQQNICRQITRISDQIADGVLGVKADALGAVPQLGDETGNSMINALIQLQEFLPS